jgi:thiol-disulfide isomerase/thioredoxin
VTGGTAISFPRQGPRCKLGRNEDCDGISRLLGRARRSAIVMLAVGLLAWTPGHASPKLKVGDMPPDRLTHLVKPSDYRGKIVVITFWASWCPPCRQEMGMLDRLQNVATQQKLMVFAVNWQQDTDAFWRIERALKGIKVTLLSDPNGYIGGKYDIDAIPHMVILGRDGRIAAVHVGYSAAEIPPLADEINSLWKQAPASSAPQPTSTKN